MDTVLNHSFAIMAYKTAPFLEQTVQSVCSQNSKSSVYISTSTPNERIESIASKYNIPLYVNHGKAGIVGDWEFALSCAETPYVTLVDQDDIYHPDYAGTMTELFKSSPDVLIAFSNYVEIDNTGAQRRINRTMRIKHILLLPFLCRKSLKSGFARRSILRIGNPICSPSVTYNLPALGGPHLFDENYTMSLDWDAWLRMTNKSGSFCFSRKPLLLHRLHDATQTSGGISGGRRYQEDLKIYKRLWPDFIAKILAKAYSESYKTNL